MSDDRGTASGALMIVSGVLTVLASSGLFLAFVWVCVGFFWLIPMAIGIAEIAVGAAVIGRTPNERARTVSVLGVLAALACGNLFGVALEIGALIAGSRARPQLTG